MTTDRSGGRIARSDEFRKVICIIRSLMEFAECAVWNVLCGWLPRCLIVMVAVAIGLASCSREVEYSDQQRSCIAQR